MSPLDWPVHASLGAPYLLVQHTWLARLWVARAALRYCSLLQNLTGMTLGEVAGAQARFSAAEIRTHLLHRVCRNSSSVPEFVSAGRQGMRLGGSRVRSGLVS